MFDYDVWLTKEIEKHAPVAEQKMTGEEVEELNLKISNLSFEIKEICKELGCERCEWNVKGKCDFGKKPTEWEW